MPKIPLYERQKSIPGKAGNVKADPKDFGKEYEALSNFGKAATGLGQQLVKKLDEARKVSEFVNAETSAGEEIKNYAEGLGDRQSKDYGTLMDDYNKTAEEIYKKYASKIKTPEAQKLFKESFGKKKALYGTQVNDLSRMMEIAHAQESVSNAVNSSIESGDTSSLEQFIPMFVESGVISREEGNSLLQDTKEKINRNMIEETAKALGEDGVRWLRGEKIEVGEERYFKPPEGVEKEELEEIAEKLELDLKLQEVKEKEVKEAENKEMAKNITGNFKGGKLTFSEIDESNMAPEFKEQGKGWLRGYIEDALSGKKSRFTKTDPKIYGEVLAKIYTDPDSISVLDILNYHGKGLNTDDMETLLDEYEAVRSNGEKSLMMMRNKEAIERLKDLKEKDIIDEQSFGNAAKRINAFNREKPEATDEEHKGFLDGLLKGTVEWGMKLLDSLGPAKAEAAEVKKDYYRPAEGLPNFEKFKMTHLKEYKHREDLVRFVYDFYKEIETTGFVFSKNLNENASIVLRGLDAFAKSLEKITPGKRGGLFGKLADLCDERAEELAQKLKKANPSLKQEIVGTFLNEVVFLGTGVLTAGFEGMGEADKKGENIYKGFFVAAGEKLLLGKLFRSLGRKFGCKKTETSASLATGTTRETVKNEKNKKLHKDKKN